MYCQDSSENLLLLLPQALPKNCNTVVVEMFHTVTDLQSLFQRCAKKKWHLLLSFLVSCGNVSGFQFLMLSSLLSFSIFTRTKWQALFPGAEMNLWLQGDSDNNHTVFSLRLDVVKKELIISLLKWGETLSCKTRQLICFHNFVGQSTCYNQFWSGDQKPTEDF